VRATAASSQADFLEATADDPVRESRRETWRGKYVRAHIGEQLLQSNRVTAINFSRQRSLRCVRTDRSDT
jgi:hypothetical protein